MTKNIFDAQTIIARVDPKTGDVASIAPRTTDAVTNLHERIIARMNTDFFKRVHEQKSSALLLDNGNNIDYSADDEDPTHIMTSRKLPFGSNAILPKDPAFHGPEAETVLWKEAPVLSPRIWFQRGIAWAAKTHYRRLLLPALSAATVLLSVVFIFRESNDPVFDLMQSAAAETRPPVEPNKANTFKHNETVFVLKANNPAGDHAATNATVEGPISNIPLEESPIRLKDAVDALTAGRIDEAVPLYIRLAEKFPQDPSIRLVLQILESKRERKR